MAEFLRVPVTELPLDPDAVPDPKRLVVQLARRSPGHREVPIAVNPTITFASAAICSVETRPSERTRRNPARPEPKTAPRLLIE